MKRCANVGIKIVASTFLALGLAVGIAEAGSLTLRHITTAILNDPDRLPALPEAPSVHYEPGARDQARRVAAILPAVMDRVSTIQGRPFAHPVIIGVYRSPVTFAAANGVGTADVGAVTFMGRITLSPSLFSSKFRRLEPILTHELSHAHLAGWMGVLAMVGLPNWFKEGLAVLVSRGSGADGVTDTEAREAISRGDRIAINDSGSLMHLTAVVFEQAPKNPQTARRAEMAYRQASLFIQYMRDADPHAFTRMMEDIEDRQPLKDAVPAAYRASVASLWSRFVASCMSQRAIRSVARKNDPYLSLWPSVCFSRSPGRWS